jgi:tetratricopeptide (TPR) repeat protein
MVVLSQRIVLSVRERLLLHLLAYQRFEGEFEVPGELTQAGISNVTGIARPNVSRAMKLLQDKELVYDKLSHIKGHKRQKKIYILTSSGISQASELDNSLGRAKIKFRTKTGLIEERTLDEISGIMPTQPNKLDIIRKLDEEGQCNYDAFDVAKPGAPIEPIRGERIGKNGYVHIMGPPAELKHFYGRKTELDQMNSWLESRNPRFILIHGIPGIGKTTLAVELVNRFREKTNVLWYELKEWDNLANVTKIFSTFLNRLGRSKLSSYYENTSKVESASVADILAEEFIGLPALIVLDDVHNAPKNLITLFSDLIPILQHQYDLKIILLSRKLVKFYNRRDVVIKKNVVEFKLEGLDEPSSRKLIKVRSVTEDQYAKIYLRTGGHPLYLELMESTEHLDDHSDMFEFIHEEIFSKLTEPERNLLKIASVYRYPVLAEAFFEDPGISYSNIDSHTHDLIMTFFYNRLTKAERLTYHKLAANYYIGLLSQWGLASETRGETSPSGESKRPPSVTIPEHPELDSNQLDEALLEVQYHLIRGGDSENAIEYSLLYGNILINSGRFELLMILDEYKLDKITSSTRARIRALKGEILTHLGDTDLALPELNRSLEDFGSSGHASELAMLSTLIGENYAALEEWDRAQHHHKQARTSLQSIPSGSRTAEDKYALARSYNNLGLASKKKGDTLQAMEFYEKGLKLLEHEGLGTTQDRAAILENLGLLLVELDQLDKAGEYFERALSDLEDAGDFAALAKLLATLGDIYVELGDIRTATEFFEKGAQYWERAEDVGHATNTFLRLSQVYMDKFLSSGSQVNLSAQPSYWDRLQRFFSSVQEDDYRKISRLYDRIGGLYMHRGFWHKSLEFHKKALELFEKIKDDRGLAKVYNNLGVLHRTRQEPIKALECYKKSVKYLEKLDEQRGLAITHLNMGRLYERLNKKDQAKKVFETSLEISRKNEHYKDIEGMALLALARQTPSGTTMRDQYLTDAQKIFKQLGDTRNLSEVAKLRERKSDKSL